MKNIIIFLQENKQKLIHKVLKQTNNSDHFYLDRSRIEDTTDTILENLEYLDDGLSSEEIGTRLYKAFKIIVRTDSTFMQYIQMIYTLRHALSELIQKRFHQDGELLIKPLFAINEIFDHVLLLLTQQWNKDQFKSFKKNQKLINKLTIVKNDLQNHLDVVYQLVKDAPIGMVACDADFIVEFWNPMATRLTGFHQGDILKKSLLQVFTYESQLQFVNKINLKQKSIVRLKVNLQTAEGGVFPAWLSVSDLKDINYGKIKYVISFFDLKKDEMIRWQREKIDQLSAIALLSSAIMHDIRNPINTIGLNLDVLEQFLQTEQAIQPALEEILTKIHRQISQLTLNLNQYLGYSRLSEFNLEKTELLENITILLSDKQNQVLGKKVQFQLSRPKGQIFILCDWIQLHRALMNLIQNAIDALVDQGIVRLEVQKNKQRVLISVIDNGPGIEAENIKHIFEPYFSRKSSGTGLGLFITREIVRGNRGRIYCTSKVNKGTRFTISLPIVG